MCFMLSMSPAFTDEEKWGRPCAPEVAEPLNHEGVAHCSDLNQGFLDPTRVTLN